MHCAISLVHLSLVIASVTSSIALTSMQKAGLRVVYSYPGLSPPQSLLDNIASGYVGGIIFFGENVGSNFSAVVSQLKAANAKSPVGLPLILSTDQEGGQVRRLSGAPTLSAKAMGLSSDPATTSRSSGTGAGQNMASYGLNVNLAPILGVYRAPGDFLDYYQRSFGNNSSIVTTCSTAFIQGQQAAGVAATAKHFPGLGAATHTQDTDVLPVTIGLSKTTLQTVDEVPYTSAINTASVQLVMPSWAIYEAVDSLPSGLSPYWLQTELRGRLGFKGVTISDAIEAGALQDFGTDSQRSQKAMAAGMDVVLAAARDASQGLTIVKAIASALDSGALDATAFNRAIARINTLRGTFQ